MPDSNDGDAARQSALEIETAAAGADLGEPVATYRWRRPPVPWRGYAILGAVTALVRGAWVYLIGIDAAVLSGPLLLLVLGLPLWLRHRSRSVDPVPPSESMMSVDFTFALLAFTSIEAQGVLHRDATNYRLDSSRGCFSPSRNQAGGPTGERPG